MHKSGDKIVKKRKKERKSTYQGIPLMHRSDDKTIKKKKEKRS